MENYPDYETVEYHLVYSELIVAARRRGTVTYQELAHVVGLPLVGNYMGSRIGNLLGAVSQNEFNRGRPMLSAVAVTSNGNPGDGFFTLAKELGLLESADKETQRAFWLSQKQQLYRIWQQQFHKPKRTSG